ncbi:uncharacterized protein LOC117177997 [Belonocnema kinseyi]|uniref:uncharacterized protein LOC117177997 n=1 Tax=Belonocnema kinseyi TaxID=2817044 RepID=UPI00143CFD00|nr:uncharacterized protein LOC117177997 [Belonocnema kinseyi]
MLKKAAIILEGYNARFKKLPNDEKNIVYCVQLVDSPQDNAYSHLLGNSRDKVKTLIENYRPTVVVRRKGGASRVCIDYRAVNKKVIRDHFPWPVIDGQLDTLAKARAFSTINLKNAFYYVEVEKESRKYTSFVTSTGNIIEGGTIKTSPEKIKVVSDFPEPKNKKMVASFLGLAGYMRKFIRGFTWMTKALRDCLKNDVEFYFGKEQHESFKLLKQALSEEPVLRMFDPRLEIKVHTDASMDGYGAVFMQKCPEDGMMHPCFYFSRATTDVA